MIILDNEDNESVDTWGGGVEKLTLWFSILGGDVQKVHFAPERPSKVYELLWTFFSAECYN